MNTREFRVPYNVTLYVDSVENEPLMNRAINHKLGTLDLNIINQALPAKMIHPLRIIFQVTSKPVTQ